MKKAPVYSHSRLSSFEQCPRKYSYRYIERFPAPEEGIEAFTGKLVHKLLEEVASSMPLPGLLPPLEAVLANYRKFWNDSWHDQIHIAKTDKVPDDYFRFGLKCLETAMKDPDRYLGGRSLAVEERIEFDLEGGDRRLVAIIDRIVETPDGEIQIHDYKTSGRLPPASSFESDRQLGLYQLAVQSRMGRDRPFRLVWHYLYFGRTFTSSRTQNQLEALAGTLNRLIRKVETQTEFPKNEGPLCRWCAYRSDCRPQTLSQFETRTRK